LSSTAARNPHRRRLIVEIPGKRRVFLSIGRVTSIGAGQIITTGSDQPPPLRAARRRGARDRRIARRKVTLKDKSGEATIEDVAIEQTGPASGRSPTCSCAGRARAPHRSARTDRLRG